MFAGDSFGQVRAMWLSKSAKCGQAALFESIGLVLEPVLDPLSSFVRKIGLLRQQGYLIFR
jgi:hypothetical protein